MRKGTIILISFLLGLILVGGYIIFDSHQNTQASTTYYTVTLNTEDKEKGTVKALEEKEYKSGEKIVLRATPAEEYVFSGWYISNELISTQNPYTYEVKDNVTIIAKFKLEEVTETPETYTVTLTAGEGGTVTELEQTEYEANSEITLQATANEGYNFLGFYDDTTLISLENPYTYTVSKNVNITAKFEVIEVTEPQPTSAKYFTFDGNACTGYIGDPNVPEIVIPRSYSKISSIETVIGAKVLDKTTLPMIVREFVSATFSDGDNKTHTYFSRPELDMLATDFPNDCYLVSMEVSEIFNFDFLLQSYDMNILQFPININGQSFNDGSLAFDYILQNNIADINFGGDVEIIKSFIDGDDYQVTSIGDYAFQNLGSLTSIIIPDTVISIGENAFINCSSLQKLIISANITSIGEAAFMNCSNLQIVVDPNNTKYLSYDGSLYNKDKTELIKGFGGASTVTILDSVTSICAAAFSNCRSLTSITIPASVTSIGGSAFNNCTALTSVTFEKDSQLKSIASSAFYNCRSLTSITIPASVTSISNNAFLVCVSLEEMIILATTPPLSSKYAFSDYTTKIYIPAGTLEAYQTADGWSELSVTYEELPA